MRRIKSSNTEVELKVRRLIHGMGYRYRLHDRRLLGSPDIVFAGRRKVIFVHGCFWHQHPNGECLDSRVPKSNDHYWIPKLARTQQRDLANQQMLTDLRWQFLIIWDCDLKETESVLTTFGQFLGSRAP
jgi:DNA mismatch endonuclease (patch repair protein)